ncbi:hypothetical protein QQ045_020461 [Rhodiola kirilowii]
MRIFEVVDGDIGRKNSVTDEIFAIIKVGLLLMKMYSEGKRKETQRQKVEVGAQSRERHCGLSAGQKEKQGLELEAEFDSSVNNNYIRLMAKMIRDRNPFRLDKDVKLYDVVKFLDSPTRPGPFLSRVRVHTMIIEVRVLLFSGQELDLVIFNMFFNQASSSYANFLKNLMLSSSATPTKNYDPLSNACTTTYQILISEVCYNVTFTWVKTWTGHSLTMKIQSLCDEDEYQCDISLQSYLFKSNKGCKSFREGKREMSLFWDMRSATHSGNPQPCSSYYIALVSNSEIVLLLGDLNNKAVNDTQSIPSSNEAKIIYTTQNVYGKNDFSTKITLAQEYNIFTKTSLLDDITAPQMWISVDGAPMVQVTNLNRRFRGNETVDDAPRRGNKVADIENEMIQLRYTCSGWPLNPQQVRLEVENIYAYILEEILCSKDLAIRGINQWEIRRYWIGFN